MVVPPKQIYSLIYHKLYHAFGPQHWWPARTQFEIVVGAILTQNTSWTNVEKALLVLKKKKLLTPKKLHALHQRQLAQHIKSAGFFNVKAKRLKNFLDFLFACYNGRLAKLGKLDKDKLRSELLSVNGIGEETADSIILYAFRKPVFVVDAYTRRIFSRHQLVQAKADYTQVQDAFHRHLRKNEKRYNEYHALIVRTAKEYCRSKADCPSCPLSFLNKERQFQKFAYRP